MADVVKSIGTSSRDYSTITLWEADINDTTYPTAGTRAVGECYDDSAFDELVVINASASNVDDVLLTVASGEEHDGTAGTGARIVRTADGSPIEITVPNVDVEWLEIDINGNVAAAGAIWVHRSAAARNQVMTVSKVLAHDNASDGTSRGIFFGNDCGNVIDSIIYDISTTGTGNLCHGVRMTRTNAVCALSNVTIHNTQNNGSTGDCFGLVWGDSANHKTQNDVVTDTGGSTSGTKQDYSSSAPSSSVTDHNLASDTSASGTGSLDSKTAANQYISTVGGSENLHLKSGADAIDAGTDLGTTPPGVEIDIDGRDRDAEGDTWDMGAHEFVAAAGGGPVAGSLALSGVGI